MTSIVVEPRAETGRARSPLTGRARWFAAALLVAGGLLQVVEFLLEAPQGDAAARLAYWSANAARIEWSQAAGVAAIPFLIGGFAVIVALAQRASRRVAWTAASLLTLAMVGLAAVHGFEMAAYALMRSGDPAAALALLTTDELGVGGAVLFVMFLGGAVFGIIALCVAMWRSPLVPRIAPVLVLAFAVLDFGVGWPVVSHVVMLAADVVVAAAVVTGYSRRTREGAE
ncbi:MAG TPA: hypothetical protein VFR67_13515 [Pilimelia sp.]|nr:hypothetical protein [Pilimelia sp.]